MATQKILWTAIPAGVVSPGPTLRVRLAVLVSPRLESAPTQKLVHFPDFLDWPAKVVPPPTIDLPQMAFKVQFQGFQPVGATRVSEEPRSDVWQALFNQDTFVRLHQFERYDDRLVRSYPVANIRQFLFDQYTKLADESGEDHPDIDVLLQGEWGKVAFESDRTPPTTVSREARLNQDLETDLSRNKAIPFTPLPGQDPEQTAKDFLQLKRFHRPRNAMTQDAEGHPMAVTVPLYDANGNPLLLPQIDFHQMLSALGEYPLMMKMLGLVVVVEADVPPGVPASSAVRVLPDWASSLGAGNGDVRNWTRCKVGPTGFLPAPAPASDLENGMLKLGDPSFKLVEVDTDGGAIKALDFAASLLRANKYRTQDTPTKFAVPSLRSGGLAVARVGRAFELAKPGGKFPSDKATNDTIHTLPDNVFLDADDVVRGYAVDVWDSESSQWHQLCLRDGQYQLTKPGAPSLPQPMADEGFATMGVSSAADGSSKDIFVAESLWNWAGWSLVAPLPGKTVMPDRTLGYPDNTETTEFGFKVRFKATGGSLPRLRYGNTYRIRARAKDVAGGGVSFEEAAALGFAYATGEIVHGRFEPVMPPYLLFRATRTEGESLERLVIRSDILPGIDVDRPTCERHIAPYKVSMQTCEECGLFDKEVLPDGSTVLDMDSYALIASREPMGYGPYDASANPPPWATPYGIGDPANRDPRYGDVRYPDPTVPVPYLPDPAARGVLFRGLPGVAQLPANFYPPPATAWPDPHALRVVLAHGPEGASVAGDIVTATLPPGEQKRVRYSSHMAGVNLLELGLWNWLVSAGKATAALGAKVLAGRHWMFTPYRTLVLVNAVRRPIFAPAFTNLQVDRLPGRTFATLSDFLTVHTHSTQKVDMLATWDEYVDVPGPIAPHVKAGVKATAFEEPVPLDTNPPNTLQIRPRRHEFGDTKHRFVTYQASALSRFTEYFLQRATVEFVTPTQPLSPSTGVVPGSEKVTAGEGKFVRGTHYSMDYPGGTITKLSAALPSQVEVAFLVPPHTRESAAVQRHVPSSARPDAPKVLYVLPAFGWSDQQGATGVLSKREGGLLRVYLERPWFSSGQDEQLGVVLHPGGSFGVTDVQDRLRPYVTQWGKDPIWASGPTTVFPAPGDFPLAVSTPGAPTSGLTLDELRSDDPLNSFKVAPHAVDIVNGFDAGRGLYFCDIKIDLSAAQGLFHKDPYFPFVRLALARYQPYSVGGAHLSRVVLADFAQLAPDRSAVVTFNPNNPQRVGVSVYGHSYGSSYAHTQGPSAMFVTVQRPVSGVSDPDLGWADASGEVALSSTHWVLGGYVWSNGNVPLPVPRGPQNPMRLVIKEYELFNPGGQAIILMPQARRLVYTDTIQI